jgi:WD40 repeat protein
MPEYAAFISYSHGADGKLAPILQRALQAFSKPWYRLRAVRVFRDEASLSANPALWPSIENALTGSNFFILLASPEAAASSWVNREVQYWLQTKSSAHVLIALTGGELAFDGATLEPDWSATTALPDALKGVFKSQPRYVDLRWARTAEDLSLRHPKFREAVADLASTIRDVPKDQLIGDDLRWHRKALATAWAGVIALLIAAGVAAWQAIVATQQRRVAQREARTATSRLLATEALSTLDHDPTLSFRLAEAALGVEPTLEAQKALFRVFDSRRCFSTAVLNHDNRVVDAAFSPDGRLIVTTTDNYRSLRLWDAETYQEIRRVGATLFGERVAFSRDGSQLLTVFSPRYSGVTQELVAWDVRTGFARQAWLGVDIHDPKVESEYVRLTGQHFADRVDPSQRSPKNDYLAKATGKTVSLLDAKSGVEVCQMVGHQEQVGVVRFSMDGTKIITASLDGTARIWFVPAIASLRALPATNNRFTVERDHAVPAIVSVTDTVRHIKAVLAGRTIQILNTATGSELRQLVGHTGHITNAVFSPDGTQLLTICAVSASMGESDTTARLWDVETGQEIRQFDRSALARDAPGANSAYEDDIAFSADGTRMFIQGVAIPAGWHEILQLINRDHIRGTPSGLTDDDKQLFGVPSTLNTGHSSTGPSEVALAASRGRAVDPSEKPVNGACSSSECFVSQFAACEPVTMNVVIDPLTDKAARYRIMGARTGGCGVSVQDVESMEATCVLNPKGDFVVEFQQAFDAAVAEEKSSCTGSLVNQWRNILR